MRADGGKHLDCQNQTMSLPISPNFMLAKITHCTVYT